MEKYIFDGVELTEVQAMKQFQNSLINRATTNNPFVGGDERYSELREILIKSKFKDICPDFIKENRSVSEFWSFIKYSYKHYEERRNFIWDAFKPVFNFLENEKNHTLPSLQKAKEIIDHAYVTRQIARMEAAINTDVDLAIGTAKELIETVCKTILVDRGKQPEKYPDNLTQLVKLASKELGQTADSIKDEVKASDIIKILLSNLAAIAQGISELRNAYGTGHGREARQKGLSPRHARLAVGAASTLVLYLWETHEERPNSLLKK